MCWTRDERYINTQIANGTVGTGFLIAETASVYVGMSFIEFISSFFRIAWRKNMQSILDITPTHFRAWVTHDRTMHAQTNSTCPVLDWSKVRAIVRPISHHARPYYIECTRDTVFLLVHCVHVHPLFISVCSNILRTRFFTGLIHCERARRFNRWSHAKCEHKTNSRDIVGCNPSRSDRVVMQSVLVF